MARHKTNRRSVGPHRRSHGTTASARRVTLAAAARDIKKSAPSKVGTRKAGAVKPNSGKATAADMTKLQTADLAEPTFNELQQRLAVAETQVRELQARLATVSDRIAWIGDNLRSLIGTEAL